MIDTGRHGDSDNAEERQVLLVKLLRHLFHNILRPEREISDDESGRVHPAFFFKWFAESYNLMNVAEVCETAGVPAEIWDALVELAESGNAVLRVGAAWYDVTLGHRQVTHGVKSINLSMLITYDDGVISVHRSYVNSDLVDRRINDPVAAAIVATNVGSFAEAIASHGLDGLHDVAAVNVFTVATPEDPFEVFMGLVLSQIPNLKEELQAPVRRYAKLVQDSIRLELPPDVLSEALKRRQTKAANGRAVGGFDA